MEPSTLRIPPTSKERYISGMVALNIPCNGSGDWHFTQTFLMPIKKLPRTFLAGEGQETDTRHFWGDAGIYDVAEQLDAIGVSRPPGPVFAASHVRATADLVLSAVLHGCSPAFVELDEWFSFQEDKEAVRVLLHRAMSMVGAREAAALMQWLDRNPA